MKEGRKDRRKKRETGGTQERKNETNKQEKVRGKKEWTNERQKE